MSYQVLQNEQCDIEIHNIQQEKKWLKKKRHLEQKNEGGIEQKNEGEIEKKIQRITIALNEYQERINPRPKVKSVKKVKSKNDSDNFLEREYQKNKKHNIAREKVVREEMLRVNEGKIMRDNVRKANIIQKEIKRRRKIYKNNIKRNVFHQWEKETNDEIEYKINQKMKWVMHKKSIYIPKIYFNEWKNMMRKCPICIGPIQDKYVTSCNHEFCTSCITKWRCTKKTCPICRTDINTIEKNTPVGLDDLVGSDDRHWEYLERVTERSFITTYNETIVAQGLPAASASDILEVLNAYNYPHISGGWRARDAVAAMRRRHAGEEAYDREYNRGISGQILMRQQEVAATPIQNAGDRAELRRHVANATHFEELERTPAQHEIEPNFSLHDMLENPYE